MSTIYTSTNEYWVVMELLPEYQQDVAVARQALGALDARARVVPLSTVAKFTLRRRAR